MKRLAYLVALSIAVLTLATKTLTLSANADDGLPVLHKIQTVTLSPSYSCRFNEEFRNGYRSTVLYISRYSQDRNAPDLLFDGACKSPDYFSGVSAGDDMSLVADLGSMPIEDVSAHLAFNPQNVAHHDANFARTVFVAEGHTYALLINKSEFRGLVVFHVDEYQPNKSVRLRYAVKEYQLMVARKSSEGFSWEGKNTQ